MSENNDKRDFTKEDDERFSPQIVIRKKTQTDEKDNTDTPVKEKSKARLWIENFFYHYKWHSIVALFLVFVILFCVLQTCQKVTYDSYILYAGGKGLRVSGDDKAQSEYGAVYDTLGRYVSDFNGDGNRNLSFIDIYLPSSQEIEEAKANGQGVNYTLLKDNDELFRQNMLVGDYYVCLISERLFLEWTKDPANNPFKSIGQYLPDGTKIASSAEEEGYLMPSEYGVYLSSVPSASRPGLKDLPADTVICIRKLTGMSGGRKSVAKKHSNAEQTLRLILADKTPD